MLYVDAYCHILPRKYQEALEKKLPNRNPNLNATRYAKLVPTLLDLEARFRLMDDFEGYCQVLTVASPSVSNVAPPDIAVELARIANDELAELVSRYPKHFVGAVATLPLNDPDAAVAEAERAVRDLRLRGVEMPSDVNGKPLDEEEFMPLYEKMAEFNLPVFIHPHKEIQDPDYPVEDHSKFRIWTKLGWPHATSLAMTRLVYSGVFERFPGIQFVTHHCGGYIPFQASRISENDDFNEMRMGHRDIFLRRPVLDYFQEFYYDTAVYGNVPALHCTRSFCGVDKMIFATDMPFDNQAGYRFVRETIESVKKMGLPPDENRQIFQDNVIRLMRLPLGIIRDQA